MTYSVPFSRGMADRVVQWPPVTTSWQVGSVVVVVVGVVVGVVVAVVVGVVVGVVVAVVVGVVVGVVVAVVVGVRKTHGHSSKHT